MLEQREKIILFLIFSFCNEINYYITILLYYYAIINVIECKYLSVRNRRSKSKERMIMKSLNISSLIKSLLDLMECFVIKYSV